MTSSVLASLKESIVDEEYDESDHEEVQTPMAIDVQADQIANEKPEPSPASLYRFLKIYDLIRCFDKISFHLNRFLSAGAILQVALRGYIHNYAILL